MSILNLGITSEPPPPCSINLNDRICLHHIIDCISLWNFYLPFKELQSLRPLMYIHTNNKYDIYAKVVSSINSRSILFYAPKEFILTKLWHFIICTGLYNGDWVYKQVKLYIFKNLQNFIIFLQPLNPYVCFDIQNFNKWGFNYTNTLN